MISRTTNTGRFPASLDSGMMLTRLCPLSRVVHTFENRFPSAPVPCIPRQDGAPALSTLSATLFGLFGLDALLKRDHVSV